tara:strand:- start:215 stop:448 length:234 start_codon:yes stop_codon:yes gene_type:complete
MTDPMFYACGEAMLIVISVFVYLLTDFKITKWDMAGEVNPVNLRLLVAGVWTILVACHIVLISLYITYSRFDISQIF